MRAYSFNYENPERISDSSWLLSEATYTRAGNDILTIVYYKNGDIRKLVVRDMDSLHKTRSYKVFNSSGIIVKEEKRTFDEDGNLIAFILPLEDPETECKWRNPNATCKVNENGDVIYYELRSESNVNYILVKRKYEYEYW